MICPISGFTIIKDTGGECTFGDDARDVVQVADGCFDHPRRSALNQVSRATLHVVSMTFRGLHVLLWSVEWPNSNFLILLQVSL